MVNFLLKARQKLNQYIDLSHTKLHYATPKLNHMLHNTLTVLCALWILALPHNTQSTKNPDYIIEYVLRGKKINGFSKIANIYF